MASPLGTFYEDVKTLLILPYTSANADRTSEVIDTAGYGRCRIGVAFAAVHDSVTQDIYLASSDAVTDENTLSSGANVANSSQTVTGTSADNTIQYIDFIPEKRYYQLVVNLPPFVLVFFAAIFVDVSNAPVSRASTFTIRLNSCCSRLLPFLNAPFTNFLCRFSGRVRNFASKSL